MDAPASQPALRLVGASEPPPPAATSLARAMAAIERANRESAALSHDDVRHIFAREVAGSLQGGRAAVLTPETRRRLLARAGRLGLRPFDASLVIAVTQDNARRGAPSDALESDERLDLIRPERPLIPTARIISLTLLAAAALLALLISWVLA